MFVFYNQESCFANAYFKPKKNKKNVFVLNWHIFIILLA